MRNTYLSVVLAALVLAMPSAAMGQQGKGKPKPQAQTLIPVSVGKGPVNAKTLIARYTTMAGSEDNATSLVNGLRNGSDITLTGTVAGMCMVACTPMDVRTGLCKPGQTERPVPCDQHQQETLGVPTGGMGWGNVQLALAFTAARLAQLDIQTATPKQMRLVLLGDETLNLPGILTLRASGLGWPQIAQQLGYTLQ